MMSRNPLAFPVAALLGGLLLFGGAMCSDAQPEAGDPLAQTIMLRLTSRVPVRRVV